MKISYVELSLRYESRYADVVARNIFEFGIRGMELLRAITSQNHAAGGDSGIRRSRQH
jgi:hypothetical protein